MKYSLFASLFLFLSYTHHGLCCSCTISLLDLPIVELGIVQAKSPGLSSISALIFQGELLEEKNTANNFKKELIFKVIKYYKGVEKDTISIFTNSTPEACGFYTSVGSTSLIFAGLGKQGQYYTWRSDCCKSIDSEQDQERYLKYIDFLEVITEMKDGDYEYNQYTGHWQRNEVVDLFKFGIKNGTFHGIWELTDRRGKVLEKGEYSQGQRVGNWKIYSTRVLENYHKRVEIQTIEYQDGKAIRELVTIKEMGFNSEGEYGVLYEKTEVKNYSILKN